MTGRRSLACRDAESHSCATGAMVNLLALA